MNYTRMLLASLAAFVIHFAYGGLMQSDLSIARSPADSGIIFYFFDSTLQFG